MGNNMEIRTATTEDAGNLAILKQQVWIATYATEGIRKEFSDYVISAFTVEKVSAALTAPSRKTWVAVNGIHLVGCIEIDFYPHQDSLPATPEITVLYVLERFCGTGIGRSLLNCAISELKAKGFPCTWLTVYHENERALRFYLKHGFYESGETFFHMEGNRYKNILLKLDLVSS
jgi:diamine N-acetyltransferase